ncbi:efflux RND transporter periplasmic adaptor subunit [candidate division KSB1 bacterium]|nr:efflux RND transporter periplasmic adaptor subunit [candidate division KSB1 bacterium]
MKKWYFYIVIALVAVVILWQVTSSNDVKPAAGPSRAQIETVGRGDLRVEVTSTGIIQPINSVEIKSKASGMIEELSIEESDLVQRNQLIARLDQRDTKNAYDQSVADLEVAEANLKQKESDFERKKDLYERGLISAAEFDVAKLAKVEAQAQLVRAKINVDNNDIRLKDTVVRSPINGVVLTKNVEVGQIISSGISSVTGGTLIATLADMSEVYVKADVDEVDIGKIKPGMKAKIAADAFPNQVFFGSVIRIAAQSKVVQNVTTFEVTIRVKNPLRRLKAGMNASVDILVADKKNVLLVPNESLMTEQDLMQEIARIRMSDAETRVGADKREMNQVKQGQRRTGAERPAVQDSLQLSASRRGVILKTENGYVTRMVQTGISNFDYTEITSGLQEGDQVVYSFFSRALLSGEEFRQRMSSRTSMSSGFRSQGGSR